MSTSPIPPVLDQDRYAAYQPTAATTDFALGFPLFGEAADIAVYLNGNPLALTTDYTVRSTANGASLTPAPVSDAYVRLKTAIASGKLEIFGNFRPRRTIQASAPYGTRDFNFAFSLLMAALREMWSKFTRAIKVPAGEAELTIPNSEDRAGQVLAFDATGVPTVGGRYADLMASASAAAISAASALTSAQAAAASAAAAQTWDPNNYVPASRKLNVGSGLLANLASSTSLSSDVSIALDFATPADTVAGLLAGKPVNPVGIALALAHAGGLKNVRFITASSNIQPSPGVSKWLGVLIGGGPKGGDINGSTGGGYGGPGGAGCLFLATVSDAVSYPVVIGGVGGNSTLTIGSTTYTAAGGVLGGAPAVATGGIINRPGSPGSTAVGGSSGGISEGVGGDGGDGPFGFGGGGYGGYLSPWSGNGQGANGIAATGYGAGGGGAAGTGGSGVGGAGTPGCLLLLEF